MSNIILTCQQLSKIYQEANQPVHVLKRIDLAVAAGESIAITGYSGCGKSTLLQLLAGLDTPSEGCVLLKGHNWQQLSETKRCQLRNQSLGFIYQFHHLLPEFSAQENVMLPLLLAQQCWRDAAKTASNLLAQVGLSQRLQHKPAELSGGEKQRVAIARALVTKPACLLADEPTGNLDQTTAQQVFQLLLSLQEESNVSIVMVTHDLSLAASLQQRYKIEQGQLIQQ